MYVYIIKTNKIENSKYMDTSFYAVYITPA